MPTSSRRPAPWSANYLERIRLLTLTDAELHERCLSAWSGDEVTAADELVVVQAVADSTTWTPEALAALGSLPCIVVSAPRAGTPAEHLDAFAEPRVADLADLVAAIEANPEAALTLALLQRGASHRSVADGLIAESSTYSLLQAGPEFAAWRSRRADRFRTAATTDRSEGPILVDRTGERLRITLNRPSVRNALDVAMRQALLDALSIAVADPTVGVIELRGTGPDFCSGGDLDEFGTATNPVAAHRIRLATSLGRLLDALANRLEVHVHGACRGSGVELAAFAHRVIAAPGTTFALPEVAMGLIPGAGGTVSVTRRTGRIRATTLALSGAIVDAPTARDWGLVDAVEP